MNVGPVAWSIRDRVLSTADHTLVMGVVNATPDSFSDGGRFAAAEDAVAHGFSLWAQGADIVDVGGESTRPGAEPVSADEEISRVVPVVSELVERGVVVSIDTTKPLVAEAAIAARAHIVNDVTALSDPDMAVVCADAGVGVVLMHMQGDPKTMQIDPRYKNVVAEVAGFLEERAGLALGVGIGRDRICIDPGIGFGKTQDHNLALLDNIDQLTATGYPVMIGTSRKGLLGAILRDAGVETSADERDTATAATVALAVAGGASVVRVHNVGHALQSARIADAIVRVSQRRL
ncbi:MAG: dihydropteroate synthase [Actinomycetota bacterium]|nr:dihydropteroate synthase [Actinomycetota bacterium]